MTKVRLDGANQKGLILGIRKGTSYTFALTHHRYLTTLVRITMTGNIVAGKNNGGYGGLSENLYAIYHVRSPKIDMAGFNMKIWK